MKTKFLSILITMLAITSNNAQKQKNILFIAIDDLKPLLHHYGATQMITPNFDRLAEMGVSFTNAHVQQAVCGPSRASVMTGMFPDHTKVWDLHTNFRKSAPSLQSMPEYLITQGYETTAVGKIYHKGSSSKGHDAKSWSIQHSEPNPEGAMLGTYQAPETKKRMQELSEEAKAKGKKKGQIRKYIFKNLKPSTEMVDVEDTAYKDGLYTKVALKKLNTLTQGNKPWFLGVGYVKPHLAFIAPKKYWDLYQRDKIEVANFQELAKGTPMLAYHSFGELRSFTDIDSNLGIGDKLPLDKQRELIHGYMACISYIDAQLGVLLDALEEKNILEDTIIVLWGDHGYHLGDHTEWNKHSNFEQATHIPFMFSGPGVAKNKKDHHPVNLVDLFPTVFELAGVDTPKNLDGKSLVPLLDNVPSSTIDMDYAISQYPRQKNKMGYSIRTENYRYTEWHKSYRSYDPYKAINIVARELYDYKKDPLETKNLVDNRKYTRIATMLQNKLKSHLQNEYEKQF